MTVESFVADRSDGPVGQPSWLVRVRSFALPVATNLWPLLLFVSQKAFVIPGLILVGFGDGAYRRDLLIASLASVCGLLVYLTQFHNAYDQVHLIGFLLFIWSVPVLNHATRFDAIGLRRILTYLTLFNVIMGFFLLVTEIDLYGLRGLNRVVGADGETHRVYFESSSLAAVALATTFRRRWLQVAVVVSVLAFMIFVARSVAIIVLLAANLGLPYILRSTPAVKIMIAILGAAFLYVLYLYLPVLRPDVDLSLRAKQFQFDVILGSFDGWSGLGWGTYFPVLSSDPEQPYQIEMQLPMLLLQLGPLALATLALSIWMHFANCAERQWYAFGRFVIFMAIGFNNPWLFLPSWFLTCQLLFRYERAE
ncbi:hypothetical protein ACAX61_16745 [Sphingomonas sp. IW22]